MTARAAERAQRREMATATNGRPTGTADAAGLNAGLSYLARRALLAGDHELMPLLLWLAKVKT